MRTERLPKVSVMVITYNQEAFIRETIESVVKQDYPNFEYIIADDGSSDSTPKIIMEYARMYPSIIRPAVGGENLGITGNSNRGLALCTGDYVALQGGDDVFLPGKLTAQVDWLEKSEKRVLCGHFLKVCDEQSQTIGIHPTSTLSGKGANSWIQKGTLYGATSVMIRRDALPPNGFDSRMATVSDWKLYIDVLGSDKEFGVLKEFLGIYRKHESNITHDFDRCSDDILLTFQTLRKENKFPSNVLNKGYAWVYLYAKATKLLQSGDYLAANGLFVEALKMDPLCWKIYVRCVQSLILSKW